MVRARAVGLTRTAVLFRPSRVAETTSDAFSRRPLLETPRGACARVTPAFPSSRARPVARGCGSSSRRWRSRWLPRRARSLCARVSSRAKTRTPPRRPSAPPWFPPCCQTTLTRRRRTRSLGARARTRGARATSGTRRARSGAGARPHHRKTSRASFRCASCATTFPCPRAPRASACAACAAARWTEASSPRASTRFGAPGPTDGTPPGSSSSPSTPWWPRLPRGGGDPYQDTSHTSRRIPTSPPNTRCPK